MGKQLFVFGLLLFLSSVICPSITSNKTPVLLPMPSLPIEFSEENLIKVINDSEIKYKDIFLAQVMKETANYTSDLFINANNLCGMRLPVFRETLAIGTYKGYAQYETWILSIEDYVIWQTPVVRKHKTRASFLAYIGRTYAKDSSYLTSIKEILHKKKQYFKKIFK
jgi:uncharacterized FlgJ-related protein